jgi:hypothetical protein
MNKTTDIVTTENKPDKLRYIFYKLLFKFLALKCKERHDILFNSGLNNQELIKLAKTVNGVLYHQQNKQAKINKSILVEENAF